MNYLQEKLNKYIMNNTTTDTRTIGEIVADNYHTADIFNKYGIDFCCGGGITLSEACKNKGVSINELSRAIREIDSLKTVSGDNFNAWEPAFLIDYIIGTHHSFVRNKVVEIAAYAEKVASVHGERLPVNIEIYKKFTALTSELLQHLQDEEQIVFPLIRSIARKRKKGIDLTDEELTELKEQLDLMVGDHDGAGDIMAEIRKLSNNFTPPEDACTTFRIFYQNLEGFENDLHKHVHLENNILFKKAEELLPHN